MKNWRLVKALRGLKKFTQKYLQVIELFKKPIYVATGGTSIRHLLFFSKKEHTFSIFSSVFLLVTKRKEIN